MQSQLHPGTQLPEHAGYLEVPGAYLYTVLHQVENPVARILLVGPFASERQNSYLPWVRWARYLAAREIEVLRYDYRGIGESTGDFGEMAFENWNEDVRLLSAWLRDRSPDAPLLLHGLELGAILAANAFHDGAGDALLLWSPPANANQALRSTLIRWIGLQQIFKSVEERKPASSHIRELEEGVPLEVEGYQWSPRLWRDSFAFALPSELVSEESAAIAYQRAVRIVRLPKDAAPLAQRGSPGYDEVKDFSWLFAPNADWIAAVASISSKGVAHA